MSFIGIRGNDVEATFPARSTNFFREMYVKSTFCSFTMLLKHSLEVVALPLGNLSLKYIPWINTEESDGLSFIYELHSLFLK